MNTTRTENGEGPYCRKVVVFQGEDSTSRFRDVLARQARFVHREKLDPRK